MSGMHCESQDAWKLLGFLKNIPKTFLTPALQWSLVHTDL